MTELAPPAPRSSTPLSGRICDRAVVGAAGPRPLLRGAPARTWPASRRSRGACPRDAPNGLTSRAPGTSRHDRLGPGDLPIRHRGRPGLRRHLRRPRPLRRFVSSTTRSRSTSAASSRTRTCSSSARSGRPRAPRQDVLLPPGGVREERVDRRPQGRVRAARASARRRADQAGRQVAAVKLNPLDRSASAIQQLTLTQALAATSLGRPLEPEEHAAIREALRARHRRGVVAR